MSHSEIASPHSPVSLKSASPTQAECVGELFICFNIWGVVTENIRFISVICAITFF